MEEYKVTRASNGDYRVVRGKNLVSNHGRRRAEAYAKAERLNRELSDH